MQKQSQLAARVYAAKEDMQAADELIRAYIPFIKSEASKFLARICTEQDDELSIAMIAFHEAIRGYTDGKGAFLNYAALTIRSRLIDYHRKEARHRGQLSLDGPRDEEEQTLGEQLADPRDDYERSDSREAARQEIAELSRVLASFGISFSDVADNCPRQERTLEACRRVLRYAGGNSLLLEELLRTKKLPLAQLSIGTGVERKTLERHRKYILAMLLIQTNGYEIIREHLKQVLKEKGGVPA